MIAFGPLPRLLFGSGCLSLLAGELAQFGVTKPLLMSDRGLEKAGVVATTLAALPAATVPFLDIPENPTTAGADAAFARYREAGCDGVIALGGGSVIDTAKFVAALTSGTVTRAEELFGRPELIGPGVAPLIAIPTTVGTGSESSHVAALHVDPGTPPVGTRSFRLVPRLAVCDPDLARSLPRRLIAATGIDALSHCVEGYFSEPANPVADALALDGIARVFADIHAALEPDGDAARASLMVAAFAGGVAIHKGLGPAHAVAVACGDQDLHHGTLIGIVLPHTVAVVAPRAPEKAAKIARALGLPSAEALPGAIAELSRSVGLPATLADLGYRADSRDRLVDEMVRSPFNRSIPHPPTPDEYRLILAAILP